VSDAGAVAAGGGGLWPHQREAVRAAAAHLACGERCQVVMACGTGKTRAGAQTSRQVASGGKVLVVVPTQELLAQTARAWAEHLGAGAGMIGAVCAQPGATADADEVRGQMGHLHGGVSTDPSDVAAWLRMPGRATVFTTYASLPAVAAAHDMPRVPGWDLAVVDEAHRAAGRAGRA
jgi:predicted helicase